MNIQLAVHRFFPEWVGGTEVYTLQLAKSLAQHGHKVQVLTAADPGEHPESRESVDGIPVMRLACSVDSANPIRDEYDNPSTARRARTLWRDTRPDVLHICHPGNLSTSLMSVAAELGIPTVVTLTDFWAICPVSTLYRSDGTLCSGPGDLGHCARCYVNMGERGARYRSVVMCVPPAGLRLAITMSGALAPRRASKLSWPGAVAQRASTIRTRILAADAVICLSEFQREVLGRWGYSLDKLRLAPHGTAAARVVAPKRRGPDSAGVRFGYIGPLAEQKGAHLPIKAFASLGPDTRATLTYWGPVPLRLDSYASQLLALISATPKATHRGLYAPQDLPAVMANLDVLIVPSMWYENTPTVIYEALAHGVPVIATGLGGMRELVLEHRAGWLFPRGSVTQLSVLIKTLATNPELVTEVAENMAPPPEFGTHVRVVEELYERLAGDRRGAT